MTATQDDTIAELQRTIAELRAERDERESERDAALAREAALAEILDLINRSPGDPGPVFSAILETAHTLCGADAGALMQFDGTNFRAVATHGLPDEFAAMVRQPFRGMSHERLIHGDRIVHVADARAVADWAMKGEVERAFVERTRPCGQTTGSLRLNGARQQKNRRVACGIAKGIGTARLGFVLCRQSQGASRDAGTCDSTLTSMLEVGSDPRPDDGPGMGDLRAVPNTALAIWRTPTEEPSPSVGRRVLDQSHRCAVA